MRNSIKLRPVCILFLFMLLSSMVSAQWLTDHQHNYKIKVPAGWSQKQYTEGSDRISDLTSSDENIGIQIRSFATDAFSNTNSLSNKIDNSLKSKGLKQLRFAADELNGMRGMVGVYESAQNGQNLAFVTYTLVKNQLGYVIITAMPKNMFQARSAEADNILKTFTITGQDQATNEKEKEQNRNDYGKDSHYGLSLPEGGFWTPKDAHWPGDGTYKCQKLLGLITLSGKNISWTGNFTDRDKRYHMAEGDGRMKMRLKKMHENHQIIGKVDWKGYVIRLHFPTFKDDELLIDVYAPNLGWVKYTYNKCIKARN